MDHNDHLHLLQEGVLSGETWADLGSGRGAFTLALAELIGPSGLIYSIDRNLGSLRAQESEMSRRYPLVSVHFMQADFTSRIGLQALDGVVMANSLHFHRHKEPILKKVIDTLKPGGRFILVEYNTDKGNAWVPHPIAYPQWEILSGRVGLVETRLLARVPSSFLREIYSALSINPKSKGD
jgi:ubiquinone/menaquinone biosynthesis C-methylase UbiE